MKKLNKIPVLWLKNLDFKPFYLLFDVFSGEIDTFSVKNARECLDRGYNNSFIKVIANLNEEVENCYKEAEELVWMELISEITEFEKNNVEK